MSAVLDDLDTRPGSATSLLRTVIGGNLRAQGGWMATSTLVRLMVELGVTGERTRTALTRLKAKGMLLAQANERAAGYRLSDDALAMLTRGDRRIYNPRLMSDGDRWCLISFSVPERQRSLRHQLRRRLAWIGCGTVAPALWVCPEFLVEEVEQIVADLGLSGQVTVFLADELRGTVDLHQAVASWWDLTAIGALHEHFLARHSRASTIFHSDPRPQTAFRVWTTALDAWRPMPYLDPGLPASLLPADWPGNRSAPLFLELRDVVMPVAAEFVAGVMGAAQTRST
jgi:phenylacetic acid degradation operon negative regulatory protein